MLVIIHSYWAAGQKRKKKARELQLNSYKVANFTLEQNRLQWQISKAICMRFSWKADDPKFLCLTGSDLPPRTSRFFSAVSLVYCAVTNFTFLSSTTIRILEMLFNANGYFVNTATSSIFKDYHLRYDVTDGEHLESSDKIGCFFSPFKWNPPTQPFIYGKSSKFPSGFANTGHYDFPLKWLKHWKWWIIRMWALFLTKIELQFLGPVQSICFLSLIARYFKDTLAY